MPQSTKPNKRALNLWKRLLQTYGDRFKTSFGPEPNEAWIEAIDDIPNDRIAYGFRKVQRESPIFPPTLAQFQAACADMPTPKTSTGPTLQEQLVAYVMASRFISPEVRAATWTYCYRETIDTEKPKSLQRCAECVGVIVPASESTEALYVSVIDMLGDLENHATARASFKPGKFVKKVIDSTSEVF